MIHRSITLALRRSVGRSYRLASLRPTGPPLHSFRTYSTVQPRILKASTLPSRDDFSMTKLVHGSTDMKIGISKRASEKLTNIAMEDGNKSSAIRIKVESGGCHGFQYNIKLTDTETELKEDDNLLVFKRTGETGKEKATLIVDESSLQILQDSKLDYTKELIGSQFKIVDSPYTSSSCGCGSSFDFDFDKLQEKLDSKQ